MAEKNPATADRKKELAAFEELATKRMDNAVVAIVRLKPLAHRRRYEFSAEHIATMCKVLRAKVDEVEKQFKSALEGKPVQLDEGFTFSKKG